MFAYCGNNPVNFSDSTGTMPKWLNGVFTFVSGFTQTVAGIAIGAAVGWTGVGAAIAGFLFINGAATMTSGLAQIINDAADTNMHEENLLKTAAKTVDQIVWNDPNLTFAADAYEIANAFSTMYSIYGGYGQVAGQIANAYKMVAPVIPTSIPTAIQGLHLPDTFLKFSDVLGGATDAYMTAIKIFGE